MSCDSSSTSAQQKQTFTFLLGCHSGKRGHVVRETERKRGREGEREGRKEKKIYLSLQSSVKLFYVYYSENIFAQLNLDFDGYLLQTTEYKQKINYQRFSSSASSKGNKLFQNLKKIFFKPGTDQLFLDALSFTSSFRMPFLNVECNFYRIQSHGQTI